MITEKTKINLDKASEIYLWMYIESTGGLLWNMNHEIAHGRIESEPDIEKELAEMRENITYAVAQLERFGIKEPTKSGNEQYWEWYRMWKKHLDQMDDADRRTIRDRLKDDPSNPCSNFSPYKTDKKLFFGNKLKKLRLDVGIGLRAFSDKMGMKPILISNIERGYEKPPTDSNFLSDVIDKLGKLPEDDLDELKRLYYAPFIMQKMSENNKITHATKSLQEGDKNGYNTKSATTDECLEISEWLNSKAKEHNTKADAYNKKNGV